MKILFYSSKAFEKRLLIRANRSDHVLEFKEFPLEQHTAAYADGFDCVSIFTNDDASAPVIRALKDTGVKYIAIRAAGYDNVDLEAAAKLDIKVANVPCYSPYAVAEHAVALMQALNRQIIKAHENSKIRIFLLDELIGIDLNQKTVGIIGTGRIGSVFAKIMHGFGCKLLAYDIIKNESLVSEYGVEYVDLDYLYKYSDIISLHVPLNNETKYMLDIKAFNKMKAGVMIINTARGALVKTVDLIYSLEKGRIGYYGADVYEKEKGIFFNNLSGHDIDDPVFIKLKSFNNVLITPHQGFATKEALANIATTTFLNIDRWSAGEPSENELRSVNLVPLRNKVMTAANTA